MVPFLIAGYIQVLSAYSRVAVLNLQIVNSMSVGFLSRKGLFAILYAQDMLHVNVPYIMTSKKM